METLSPLPIDPLLPEVTACLASGRDLVLVAEPGAGKTTRVPRALLDAGLLAEGECWVLEPRRLAARLAAVRVAEELGEPLGERVGYAVRFEQKVSRATRIRFVTEGLLVRRLQQDPTLKGISVVILDEFHERHLHTDLALGLLRDLQRRGRPDLRLVVMSATLDADPVAAFLGALVFRSPGRAHPVEVRHLDRPDDRPLGRQVAEAVDRLYGAGATGHTLVFLPGAAEIRQCLSSCAEVARRHGLDLRPLHGSLSFEAQKAAVAPSERPKVLLSTNVAESSVTLDGVRTVIDSGLGREALHSAWTGLSSLRTTRISQARCIQRTGRAGRQAPGLCLRLFPEADFRVRPSFDAPELQRTDLAELALVLAGLGRRELDWFEAPPTQALSAARELLRRLGALDGQGGITPLGRRMAGRPLHPRLARLVEAGQDLGVPDSAALAAVLLETGDLQARQDLGRCREPHPHALDSDLWPRMDAFREAEADGFGAGALRAAGLDAGAIHQARQAWKALGAGRVEEPGDGEERLLRALLAAFPDRVARLGGNGTLRGVGGWGGRLDAASRCRKADLVVALDAEEVARGAGREVLVRAASRVEPEWLLEAFPDALMDEEEVAFNPVSGRVERRSVTRYEDLVIDETRRGADPSDPATAVALARAALARGEASLGPELADILDRASFLARVRADLGLPPREELAEQLVAGGSRGCQSLKALEGTDWGWAFRQAFGEEVSRLLDAWAPTHLQLPRRRARIDYGGESPCVASRLQDFLGMTEAPRIAGGQVALVVHLLAPNMRAVQVTTDLAGFWQRAYRELRPQLSRRYPRHAWPEDPSKPEPVEAGKGR